MSLHERMDCLVDFVGMIFVCLLPPSRTPTAPFCLQLPSPNCFFRVRFLPTLSAADLKDFLPRITSPISVCSSKLQHVSTYAFCSWDDIFTQKWNCSSPSNLCKSPKSPSTLSTNRSIVWNFYLLQPFCSIVRFRNECWRLF